MRVKFLGTFLIIIITFTMNSCSTDTPKVLDYETSSQKVNSNYIYNESELETMNLINTYRTSIGLKVLKQNNYISLKSEEHIKYMITNNVVNHDNFPTRSQNIIESIGATNVAENIAYNYNIPQSVLTAWLNSPSHKKHIEGDFTHFGISIRVNSDGKKYYTNIFIKI